MARINDWIMSLSRCEKLIAPSTEYTVRWALPAAAAGVAAALVAPAVAMALLLRLVSIRLKRAGGNRRADRLEWAATPAATPERSLCTLFAGAYLFVEAV